MKQYSGRIAEAITKSASKQTYYTIRFLVDRKLQQDAFRAYAYFRWVDDQIDEGLMPQDKAAFLLRQMDLVECCYQRDFPDVCVPEEEMLVDMVRNDSEASSGLQSYIRSMMAVMAFDADRKGKGISQSELSQYTYNLAQAVTEALHHFIGNGCITPLCEERYYAVTAAHITHMLRDTREDVSNGYYNIPIEYLDQYGLKPWDIDARATREWTKSRVAEARFLLEIGKYYIAQVKNFRCRVAGFAYVSRFEHVLEKIELDNFFLRENYRQNKGIINFLKMGLNAVSRAVLFQTKHPPFTNLQINQG